jgi:hypothetical protein
VGTDLVSVQADAREALARLVPQAIETLSELALGAERDNVRLAAAEAILDRTGLARGQTQSASTSKEEHEQVTLEAGELLLRLERNRLALPVLTHTPALDTLAVLEGEEEALPVAAPYPDALEAASTSVP